MSIFLTWLFAQIERLMARLYPSQSPKTPPTAPIDPAKEIDDAEPQPKPVEVPSRPMDKVRLMALAQQSFEGWFLPGSTHDGIYYPKGSPSYQRMNPGNCTAEHADNSIYFIIFPTYEAGLAHLEQYIRNVATGHHPAYPKGGNTTILEYTHIYTADKEPAPTNYAHAIATALGVPVSTPLSFVLS